MARLTSDSRRLSDLLSWGLIDLSWGLLTMVFTTVVMFSINWRLGLLVLTVMPILITISIYFRKKILHAYRKIRKEKKAEMIKDRISATTLEAIASEEGQTVKTAMAINMKNPTLSGAGREPKVIGTAFGLFLFFGESFQVVLY